MPIDLGAIIGQLFGAGKTRQKMDQWGNTTFEPVAPVADIIFNQGRGRQKAMDLNMMPYLQQMELKKAQQLGDINTAEAIKRKKGLLPYENQQTTHNTNESIRAGEAGDMRGFQASKGLPPNEAGRTAYMEQAFGNDVASAKSRSIGELNKAQLGEGQSGEGLKQFYNLAPSLRDQADLQLQIDLQDLKEKLALADAESSARKAEIGARQAGAEYLTKNPEAKYYQFNRPIITAPGSSGFNPQTGEKVISNPKEKTEFDKMVERQLGVKNTATPGANNQTGKPTVVQTLANGNIILSTGQVIRPDGSVVE